MRRLDYKNRFYAVDVAKGVGIFLVVYGHVARGLFNAGMSVDKLRYELIDSVIYSFHMPLFFFVSGLFLLKSIEGKSRFTFVEGKVRTIFYPYVVWSVLQGVIEVVLSSYTNGNVGFGDVAEFLWRPRAQFWYLYVLFIMQLIAVVVYRGKGVWSFFVFCFALTMYFVCCQGFFEIKLLNQIFFNFVFVTLGVLAGLKFDLLFRPSKLMLVISSVLFVVSQFVFHFLLGLRYGDAGVPGFLNAVISIVFVLSVSSFASGAWGRFLAFLGSSSMVIYLMHVLVGSGFRIALSKVFGVDDFSVHLVLGTLVAIAVPLLFFKFFGAGRAKLLFSLPK